MGLIHIRELKFSRMSGGSKMDRFRGGRPGGSSGGSGGGRSFGGPREMSKATCSECGNECEVPFKPTEGKPVYCRDCYQKRKKF